jgi:hypothetical protein
MLCLWTFSQAGAAQKAGAPLLAFSQEEHQSAEQPKDCAGRFAAAQQFRLL